MYKSKFSSTRHELGVSGQFLDPAVLFQRTETTVPIGYKGGWSLEPAEKIVWKMWESRLLRKMTLNTIKIHMFFIRPFNYSSEEGTLFLICNFSDAFKTKQI
jgi:hypothetical protein